jgi:hypothetical protein
MPDAMQPSAFGMRCFMPDAMQPSILDRKEVLHA